MLKEFTNETVTSTDISKNQSGSIFKGCKLQGIFDGFNFSYASFVDCDFNCVFKNCNMTSCENIPNDSSKFEKCNRTVDNVTHREFRENTQRRLMESIELGTRNNTN